MTNALMVIAPYWYQGTWVFDDESVELDKEPFVAGVPEMIDDLVKDIPNARNGFRLIFSSTPFPGSQRELTWVREEYDGNWYKTNQWKAGYVLLYFGILIRCQENSMLKQNNYNLSLRNLEYP